MEKKDTGQTDNDWGTRFLPDRSLQGIVDFSGWYIKRAKSGEFILK